jgi:dephospho-CoA kinase
METPLMDKTAQLQNKYIIGVTGGIGCGKTTVTKLFAAKGIEIVDADVVARDVVIAGSKGLKALTLAFGKNILTASGELDRSALREIIFASEEAKERVNGILHPLIRENMLNQLQNTESQYCMLSAPLLFENNLHHLVRRTLVVDITEAQQLSRTLSRDGGNASTIKSIMAAQVTREKRLRLADDIIDNSKTIDLLAPQVDLLHSKYCELSQNALSST